MFPQTHVPLCAAYVLAFVKQQDKSDNAPRILAALQRLTTAAAPDSEARAAAAAGGAARLLVVVDNAEDALGQAEAAEALRTLMGKVCPFVWVSSQCLRILARAPGFPIFFTSSQARGRGGRVRPSRRWGCQGYQGSRPWRMLSTHQGIALSRLVANSTAHHQRV